jgi:RNA polymerase sigma factor (sigma-70 family)
VPPLEIIGVAFVRRALFDTSVFGSGVGWANNETAVNTRKAMSVLMAAMLNTLKRTANKDLAGVDAKPHPATSMSVPPGAGNNDAVSCTEKSLLARLSQGEESAFWTLWSAHQHFLFLICMRRMHGSRADAEDALSRIMLKVRNHLPRHAVKICNLRAWLTRVAVNQCADLAKEIQRTQAGFVALERTMAEGFSPCAICAESPETIVLLRELNTVIARSIDALPLRLGETATLFFLNGISYQETSIILGISNDNVRKRIQEVRALLRKALTRYLQAQPTSSIILRKRNCGACRVENR